MFCFKNLTPYSLDGQGKLSVYPNNKIWIKGRTYRVDNHPYRRIERYEHIKVDDEGYILNDKGVIRICKEDCNNPEICVKLSTVNRFIYRLSFIDVKVVFSKIGKFFVRLVKLPTQ